MVHQSSPKLEAWPACRSVFIQGLSRVHSGFVQGSSRLYPGSMAIGQVAFVLHVTVISAVTAAVWSQKTVHELPVFVSNECCVWCVVADPTYVWYRKYRSINRCFD